MEHENKRGGLMNTKDLFDKEVLDVNAVKVGKVVDIDFDLKSGVLNHMWGH